MVIRPKDFYDGKFHEESWTRMKREVYGKDGINNEDIIGYVFRKEYWSLIVFVEFIDWINYKN